VQESPSFSGRLHRTPCVALMYVGQCSSLPSVTAASASPPAVPCCRLRTVPPALLSGCPALATLSLHSNPLTAEELREVPGWRQFDERRRTKYDKQVTAGCSSSSSSREQTP
jgi:hypothetical protein